ncbi:uncharacterized protein LOC100176453 isoform X3 [Ciona intestinalis]
MSDSDHEGESILNNLNKTRQLWSSKADIGTIDYLAPKSPLVKTASPKSPSNEKFYNGGQEDTSAAEVVKADEQVVEDYELPDIKSMRSQWEVSNASHPAPSPSHKAPAAVALAREKSVKRQLLPENIVPVNREEVKEENYAVELNKLKAQFENTSKCVVMSRNTANYAMVVRGTRLRRLCSKFETMETPTPVVYTSTWTSSNAKSTPTVKSPISKTAIKDSVSKKSSSLKGKSSQPQMKKIRFQDEIFVQPPKTSEPRVDVDGVNVDLSSIKSHFEIRKDEQAVAPRSPDTRNTHNARTPEPINHVTLDVIRPDDAPTDEVYEVELGELKKKFENSSVTKPEQIKPKEAATKVHYEVKTSLEDSRNIETVKSSEPVYDEMIGEDSVKDRLKRYKSMTQSDVTNRPKVERRISQKKSNKPVVTIHTESATTETTSVEVATEIVRSPPAGTKITPDYTPSTDLRQTKAIFETSDNKPRRSRPASASSGGDSNLHSPPRIGRSPDPQPTASARSTSRHSTASTSSVGQRSRSRSPGQRHSDRASNVSENEDMADVVRPPPAGTKESADYVPAVKVSSMKSMFEKPSSTASSPTSSAPPPRRLKSKDWVNVSNASSDDGSNQRKVVAEGSYEEKEGIGGVVRPPTAGTKELPAYSLSQDFLKSRAAMFDSPTKTEYTPKNKIKLEKKPIVADVVNEAGKSEMEEYVPSQSLKDAKKVFEEGASPTNERPVPAKRTTEVVATPTGEVVRPPPAGTRDDTDIVPAQNLRSVKDMFDQPQDVAQEEERKQPIDIEMEAREAVERERDLAKKATEETQPQETTHEPEPEEPEPQEPEPQEPEPQEPEPQEPEPQEPEPQEPVETSPTLEQNEPEPEPTSLEAVESDVNEPTVTSQDDTPRDESDDEGEYVLQTTQENIQEEEISEQHDEAAAVTPVRVAVPSSPTPEDEPEAQEAQVNVMFVSLVYFYFVIDFLTNRIKILLSKLQTTKI